MREAKKVEKVKCFVCDTEVAFRHDEDSGVVVFTPCPECRREEVHRVERVKAAFSLASIEYDRALKQLDNIFN